MATKKLSVKGTMSGSHSKGEIYADGFIGDGYTYIQTEDVLIARMSGTSKTLKSQKANAERIVKAWNSYDEMLCVLKEVKSAYCGVGDFDGTGENITAIIHKVDAAIKNATKK